MSEFAEEFRLVEIDLPLVCLVGLSGSGKDTIQQVLHEKYWLHPVISHTSRPPRPNEGDTHYFTSKVKIEQMISNNETVAHTYYDGNVYAATLNAVDDAQIYIVDAEGIFAVCRYAYRSKRDLIIVEIRADESVRAERMLGRGQTKEQVERRLLFDRGFDIKSAIRRAFRMVVCRHGQDRIYTHYINDKPESPEEIARRIWEDHYESRVEGAYWRG